MSDTYASRRFGLVEHANIQLMSRDDLVILCNEIQPEDRPRFKEFKTSLDAYRKTKEIWHRYLGCPPVRLGHQDDTTTEEEATIDNPAQEPTTTEEEATKPPRKRKRPVFNYDRKPEKEKFKIRVGSKKHRLVDRLQQFGGATIEELMEATDWSFENVVANLRNLVHKHGYGLREDDNGKISLITV